MDANLMAGVEQWLAIPGCDGAGAVELGKRFGIHSSNIYKIVTRLTWKSIST